MSVKINEQIQPDVALFLQTPEGELFANSLDLEKWHFMLPESQPMVYQNQLYYSLNAFEGLKYTVDAKEMRVNINAPYKIFTANHLNTTETSLVDPSPPSPGGFLNYDFNQQQSSGAWAAGGIFEAGYFNSLGIAISEFLVQGSKINGQVNNPEGGTVFTTEPITFYQTTRLNSNFRHDNPVKMTTTILGDTYNMPGAWGRSVGFGGIQWGTNFSTQPAFITFPLPSAKGEALVPSVVDLYVNNSLVSSSAVPPGPFSMNYIPVVTGQGNVSIVTTDLLGRQSVVNVPYYASTQLLREGLQDFSYEMGFVRQNFGLESNDYSEFMAVGTHRLGISDTLTGELHGELLSSSQTLGAAASYLWSDIGVLNGAVAGSVSSDVGALVSVGFQRQTFKNINFGFNTQITTSEFTQLGFQDDIAVPAVINQAFVGIPFDSGSSLGVTYTTQNGGEAENASFLNASYNTSWHDWSFAVTTLINLGGSAQNGVFLTLARTINSRTTFNMGAIAQNLTNQGFVQLTRNLPVGDGLGYNLLLAEGENSSYQATLSAQNRIGEYSATVSKENNDQGYRLDAEGSVVTLGNQIYMTRRIPDSFGVVQIPGYAHVDVYEENQLIGYTDEKGYVLVPNLLSYQGNRIRIDENQLPLNTEIDTTQISVVPYYRSGVLVRFPVRQIRSATLTLLQNSKQVVPAGTVVHAVDNQKEFVVGRAGMLYVTDLNENTVLEATWEDKTCQFSIRYPETTDPLPDLGEILCH